MHYILDLECDNLLNKVTKIHCIVMKDINTNEVFTDLNVCIEKIKTAKMRKTCPVDRTIESRSFGPPFGISGCQ